MEFVKPSIFNIKIITMHDHFKSLSIIFLLYFLYGCASQSSKKAGKITDSVDTVYKDIPPRYLKEKVRKYNLDVESSLGLQSIQGGYNDAQIRIWVDHGYGRYDTSQLFIFKKRDTSFSGVFYTYVLKYDSLWNPISTSNKIIKALTPNSGWNTFVDSLKKLGIYSLPDYEKLNGYYLSSDPYGVTVEFATNNKYRIYCYPDYQYYKTKIDQATKMYEIIRLIEQEFNIRVNY